MKHILEYLEFIGESAGSTKVYYHGTDNTTAGESILESGIIRPGNTEDKASRAFLKPMFNRVYLTPKVSYAQIYAIGGDYAGAQSGPSNRTMETGQYGYVFEVKASDIHEPMPDEDFIGEMVYIITKFKNATARKDQKELDSLEKFYNEKMNVMKSLPSNVIDDIYYTAHSNIPASYMKKLLFGEYIYFAKAGKKLVKFLLRSTLDSLVANFVGAISSLGETKISGAWRIDKALTPQLKRDGSNFFDHAEKVL
jgi:hypothetical protein